MTEPTVSLLVPVFNRAELIGQCLESALSQTWPDFEVVVVDGASTDGTWSVCQRYAEADSRIRIIQEGVNGGPVRGWRRCLDEARGKFGTFLWSDDIIRPTFLEVTLPFLHDDQVAFAFTGAEIGPSPGSGKLKYSGRRPRIPSRTFILGALATPGRYPSSPACALFRISDIRRNFTERLPLNPEVDLTSTGAGTDLLMYLLEAERRPVIGHVPAPLAFFRAHPGSITIEGRAGQVNLHYALTKSWFASQFGFPELVPRILGWHWLDEMRIARRWISPRGARKRYHHFTDASGLLVGAVQAVVELALSRFRT